MTNQKPWRFILRDNTVRIRTGKNGGALQWLPYRDLRAFADDLHDLADQIEREQPYREEP